LSSVRALVLKKHGPPDQALEVQDWPEPSPGRGQILVDVRAAGINFADILGRMGLYPDAPKTPCVMGYEVAGTVAAVGPDAEFAQGDRVIAATHFEGFAEKAVADTKNVLKLPEGMSFEQGAALPVNYGTAYAALILFANVRRGETVLVNAAAGGVGIAALQILKTRGAQAIGTASASKHDAIRAQGAVHTIDYRNQDVAEEVKRITEGRGVDVVLDSLGEFRQSYKLLGTGGRLVMYGVSNIAGGERRNYARAARELLRLPRFNPIRLMNQNKAVIGLNLLHWWDERGSLEEVTAPLIDLLEQGAIDPVVAEAFPFDRAADAHRFIQERKNIGKVVLTW
jgi:NADPH:quinone reductase-like Zn-dependent oxidoreductase